MTLTAAEQFLIELINRARLDPLGEAKRFGVTDLNNGLAPGTISGQPLRALAPNIDLEEAADAHSAWMLQTDIFSHTGVNGSSAQNRIAAAGYDLSNTWAVGENLALSATTGAINLNTEIANHHRDLFLSAGHRANTLSGAFREIGVAQVQGIYTTAGQNFNASMLTENFGRSNSAVFLTGAVFTDMDRNAFYTIGEGVAGARFSIGQTQASSQAAGGYSLATQATANLSVTVTSGVFSAVVRVDLSGGNGKLNLVDGKTLETSIDLILDTGVTEARALGVQGISLTGSAAADRLEGNSGANLLGGGNGADTLVGGAGNDTLNGGIGADSIDGGEGNDTISFAGSVGLNRVDLMSPSVNLGSAVGDTYISVENIIGGAGSDDLRGTLGNNVLDGGRGVDILYGRAGSDTLIGGMGNDILAGGAGADRLIGGEHRDIAHHAASRDHLTVDLADPTRNTFEAAGDTYDSIEDIAGGFGNDTLAGDSGPNGLYGREGADQLSGEGGNDYLNGGAHGDRLDGGLGNDVLRGGTQADTFVFNRGHDVIEDFSAAQLDKIQIDRQIVGGSAQSLAALAGYAALENGGVLFDFGAGNTLSIRGLTSLDGLVDHLI